MKSKTPTRLELHRLKFSMNERIGDLLSFDELDEFEREIISKDFFDELRHDKKQDPYEAMLSALSSWGIMCMHPSEKLEKTSLALKCRCCGCIVLKKDVDEIKIFVC